MPPLVDLVEGGAWQRAVLGREAVLGLQQSRVVEVRPGPGFGEWEVRAGRWVGAARIGGTEIRIAPKVPVARLMFLLGYTTSARWRDEPVDLGTADGLVPAAAEALSRQVEAALRGGLLQGYVTVEESAATVRGRMREADQIRRRYGALLPVEVRYDDFTHDTAENRILRTAVDRCLALPGITDTARRRLARQRSRLAEVTPLVAGARLPDWIPSRLNARYGPALRLAELVMHATSWDLGAGEVPVTGFLVDMPKAFEDFVCTAMGEVIRRRGGDPRTQDASRTLDEAGGVSLRPDLVWYQPDGRPRALVDAKYKAEKPEGFPNADVYQALAYCTAYGLGEAHLVYARGNEQPRRYRIPGAGVTVTAHCLDLDAAPGELLAQVEELVGRIEGGVS